MDRYIRHTMMPEVGAKGQRLLSHSRVIVVGVGAIGSVVSMYLAGAGVGNLTVCDFDTIDTPNLQRQVFYSENEVGRPKAAVLADKIHRLNSEVEVDAVCAKITRSEAERLFARYDFVVEGSDNPSTKYMVAEVCEALSLPYCIGGVCEFSGQVMTHLPGTASYSSIFPNNEDDSNYAPPGVLAPLPGIVGAIQASETLKVLMNVGKPLIDVLLCIDLRKNIWQIIDV